MSRHSCLASQALCQSQSTGKTTYDFPNIFYTNPRSVVSKIDEIYEVSRSNNIDLICITESWLTENIPDNCVSLEGFTTYRCDRVERKGGGICAWIKTEIPSAEILRHQCDDFESLWLKARPAKLPRQISSILVAVIYRTDNTKDQNLLEQHIVDTADSFLVKHPDAGVIITGDFNRMCTKSICRKQGLKQLVKFPTRADAILDLILTNMQDFYNEPTQLPPIGRSDHNSIILTLNDSVVLKGINTTVYRRRLSGVNLSQVSNWLRNEKWDAMYYNPLVEEKTSIF